jgi:hypothetical protein
MTTTPLASATHHCRRLELRQSDSPIQMDRRSLRSPLPVPTLAHDHGVAVAQQPELRHGHELCRPRVLAWRHCSERQRCSRFARRRSGGEMASAVHTSSGTHASASTTGGRHHRRNGGQGRPRGGRSGWEGLSWRCCSAPDVISLPPNHANKQTRVAAWGTGSELRRLPESTECRHRSPDHRSRRIGRRRLRELRQ